MRKLLQPIIIVSLGVLAATGGALAQNDPGLDLEAIRARAAMALIDSGSAKLTPAVVKAALAAPPPMLTAPGAGLPGMPQQPGPNAQ